MDPIIGAAPAPADTANLVKNAKAKRVGKHADWIVANDVSRSDAGFAGGKGSVHYPNFADLPGRANGLRVKVR